MLHHWQNFFLISVKVWVKGVNKLRVIFRGALHNVRTSCVTVNTAKSVWHRYCDEKQSLKRPDIWKITRRRPWTHQSPLPIYFPFPNDRGVRAVWSTTNFNVGPFADHKVSKHVNKTCSPTRKIWKVSAHVNKTCSNSAKNSINFEKQRPTFHWWKVTRNQTTFKFEK